MQQATDYELASLARCEARCRLLLGRLAAAFSSRSGHHRLGFARLGDYARERLGLSGREVQGLASVAARLGELPAIESAFLQGELSWSQVRLLAVAASPQSEAEWLGRAEGKTVRALLREIREGGEAADDGSRSSALDEVIDQEAGAIDGEETARLRVRCPARVRVLWRRTIELGRRMLGAQASVWQAAEAIAAEGLSAAPVAGGGEEQGGIPEAAAVGAAGAIDDAKATGAGDAGATDGADAGGATPGPGLGASRSDGASLPDDVTAILRNIITRDGPVETPDDPDGSDPFALDSKMRSVIHAMGRIDAETARHLRRLLDLGLHRALGYSSFDSYVRERLGMSPSRARALVRIERRAGHVPELSRAWRRGEISWVRLQTILPVVTSAGLGVGSPCGGVACGEPGIGCPDPGGVEPVGRQPAGPGPGGVRPGDARSADPQPATRGAAGWIIRAGEVTVRQLAREVDRALDAEDLQMCARSGEGEVGDGAGDRAPDEAADREVTFCGPASVVGLFRDAVRGFTPPREPAWKGLERLLLHACQEWMSQPRHRDPVFERDGWRCAVPACGSRRNLHDHHRRYRSRGGTNERSNRVTACALCRTRHNAHYADFRIMPHGLREVLSAAVERELQAA